MTKTEFIGQFDRLCRGLEYTATPEQTEAIYRRIGNVGLSVWAESVTTLLCDGRKGLLPKLEHVLTVVDHEAEAQRRAAVQRDKRKSDSVFHRLCREVDEAELSRIPMPGTPLFACIQAFSSRENAAKKMLILSEDARHSDAWKEQERVRLDGFLRQAEQDIAQYSQMLDDEDAAKLSRRYESNVAV
ncbi:hypothetical protein [Nitrospira sp. BLG_1]|uniref:hypothetical protein n=1 Tax=Nitrospira sp. BLG_1 TaxID=3395883 RepID=UPI0039BD0D5A